MVGFTRKKEEWVDPTLLDEVRKYGKFDVNACLNCGGCTIGCSLSSSGISFSPRRVMQYARLGLKDKLLGSLDPWLCYYCGECSTLCPRQTETGESMMTMRRYLIGQYDWTGLTSRIYRSDAWMIGLLTAVALAMVALTLVFYPRLLEFGHLFTLGTIFFVSAVIFAPNIVRMYLFTVGKAGVPFLLNLDNLKSLLYGFTQLQIMKCKDEKRSFWIKHMLVAVSWVLTVLMSCIGWIKTTYAYPIYHPFKLAMIIIPAVLFVFTGIMLIDRISKRGGEMHKFSKFSDWAFLIGLFMMAFTFWVVYIALSLGMEKIAYLLYAFHLVILGPWALVLVPFSKTTHFLYRPFALYFHALREKACQTSPGEGARLQLEEVR